MYKRILIATDGSELSSRAVAQGIAVAKAFGASVVGFHARPSAPLLYTGEAAIVVPPEIDEAYERQSVADAEKYLDAVASAARRADVPFRGVHYASGSPADAILDVAKKEGCDLVVMASHGRKGIARVLLGSETVKVLTHAACAVLVTH
jgi:nucleotide-binding universal stress UspA family protein